MNCTHCGLRTPETCLPGPCSAREWKEPCVPGPFVPAYAGIAGRRAQLEERAQLAEPRPYGSTSRPQAAEFPDTNESLSLREGTGRPDHSSTSHNVHGLAGLGLEREEWDFAGDRAAAYEREEDSQ